MSIDAKTIEHIAELARLHLTEEEKGLFSGQLGDILEWAAQLKKAEISENTVSFEGPEKPPAADKPEIFKDKESLIKNFPAREFDLLKTKKAIED